MKSNGAVSPKKKKPKTGRVAQRNSASALSHAASRHVPNFPVGSARTNSAPAHQRPAAVRFFRVFEPVSFRKRNQRGHEELVCYCGPFLLAWYIAGVRQCLRRGYSASVAVPAGTAEADARGSNAAPRSDTYRTGNVRQPHLCRQIVLKLTCALAISEHEVEFISRRGARAGSALRSNRGDPPEPLPSASTHRPSGDARVNR